MFLENHLFHLDFQIYRQKVEQDIPHYVHQSESQGHNAEGNAVKAILWRTKTKVFQAAALSWFSLIQE